MKFKKRNIQIVDHSTGQTLDFPTFGKQAGEEAINELEQNVDNKIAELKSLVGTPLKASTASAMNNRDKIYVYTGNETGYTNGHWYYYDGTNWSDGGVYNSTAVETDKTLSVENVPADAKKTGDELDSLKSDLNAYIQFINPKVFNTNNLLLSPNVQIFPNKMYYSAEERDATTLSYAIVPMIGGETYVIVPPARFITYNTGVEATNTPANYEFTPSSDRDVYITFRNDIDTYGGWCVYKKGSVEPSKVGSYQVPCAGDWLMNASCVEISPNMLNTALSTNGYYMDTTGNTNPSATGVLSYSAKIPVEVGKTYYIKYENSNRAVARYITAFNGSTVVSASGATYAESWTCPSGVTDIIITYYNDAGTVMFSDAVRDYIPYGVYYVPFDKIEYDEFKKNVNEVLSNQYKYNYLTAKASTLVNAESINLPANSVKTKKSIAFTADITLFDALYIGHGKSAYASSYMYIDDTNIIVYDYNDTVVGTYAHGLTFLNNVQVYIEKKTTQKATVHVYTNGHVFEQQNIDWMGDNGNVFVKSDGSTLKDCVLSWTSKTLKSDIWLFGDSYIGIANTSRWTYHLLNDGYTDILLSGYGGCDSASAYQMLTNILPHGKPKKIIWCLGMNDNDNSSAANATWLSNYNKLVALCEINSIELILATIPNAVGGSVDDNPDTSLRQNKYKNEIVKSSGYRYIDFAKAVGSNEDGTWFDGMLSADGVHPTEYGAKALYLQALADAPELMTT